jgi:hypothetical protein
MGGDSMLKTTAIIHAPGVDESQLRIMVKKLDRFVERMNFYQSNIRINNYPVIDTDLTGIYRKPSNLIIGWGLFEKPDWSNLVYAVKTSTEIRIFIGIDLYETSGIYGRVLMVPTLKNGRYWRHKSWHSKCKRFLNGGFVSYVTPFGMKRIPGTNPYSDEYALSNYTTLVPGAAHEIEIVRLMFDLYVNHGYSMTDITNLLNAQGVTAPHRSKVWNPKKVKNIITSVFYIGSNQFGACIKHNVFPAIVDRSTFYTAQARIYEKQLEASAST